MFYPIFLLIGAIEMLWESRIASRNSRALMEKGAIDVAPGILPVMVTLYALLFVGSFVEYFLFPKEVPVWWFLLFLALYVCAKALKYWAVSALGPYWTMKVLIIPGSKVVTSGPYRWIRHPNYDAVLLEIAAIALAGKSWITFTLIFASFSFVLYHRIRSEERALAEHTNYSHEMMSKGRLL
jgi:methyltransferase